VRRGDDIRFEGRCKAHARQQTRWCLLKNIGGRRDASSTSGKVRVSSTKLEGLSTTGTPWKRLGALLSLIVGGRKGRVQRRLPSASADRLLRHSASIYSMRFESEFRNVISDGYNQSTQGYEVALGLALRSQISGMVERRWSCFSHDCYGCPTPRTRSPKSCNVKHRHWLPQHSGPTQKKKHGYNVRIFLLQDGVER
jgi:hypothetical protein